MEDKKICPLCDMTYEHSHFTYDIVKFTDEQNEKYEVLANKHLDILRKHKEALQKYEALLIEHGVLQEKLIKALSENALLEEKLKQN
jgi:hypothetical protein